MSRQIPTVEDLAADAVTRRFDDMFAPPGLTNFLGAAQVDHDIAAVRSVNFPPVGQGDTVTGQLFIDGRLFRSLGAPVTFALASRPGHPAGRGRRPGARDGDGLRARPSRLSSSTSASPTAAPSLAA